MKITTNQLRRIIAEEVQRSLNEATPEQKAEVEKVFQKVFENLKELGKFYQGSIDKEKFESVVKSLEDLRDNM